MPDNTGFFSTLELDSTFDFIQLQFNVSLKYPPIRNLVLALDRGIPIGLNTGLLSPSFWSDHLSCLDALDLALAEKSFPLLTDSGEQKNPARGYMGLSPVSDALTQRVQPEIESQYYGACLFLLHEIEKRKLKKTPFKMAADSLRIVATDIASYRLFLFLPDPIKKPDTYIEDMRSALSRFSSGKDARENRLKSALLDLTGSVKKIKRIRSGSGSAGIRPIKTPVQISAQGGKPVFGGKIQESIEPETEIKFDPVPYSELFYQESLDLDQTELPDLGFEEVARQAGYWVDRNSQLSRISRSVFNSLEQSRLVNNLADSLKNQSFENSLCAAIVAISYVTGLQILSVAKASMNREGNQQVFTQDGQYIRKIWAPRLAGNDIDHVYKRQELAATVSLVFPDIIRNWFLRHGDRLKFYNNLGSVLNMEEEVLQKTVESFVGKLRDHGRYQITLPRIASSLPAHLTISLRNPVITTLLSGNPDQPAPMLMYYQSVSVEGLKGAYEKVTRELMEI